MSIVWVLLGEGRLVRGEDDSSFIETDNILCISNKMYICWLFNFNLFTSSVLFLYCDLLNSKSQVSMVRIKVINEIHKLGRVVSGLESVIKNGGFVFSTPRL